MRRRPGLAATVAVVLTVGCASNPKVPVVGRTVTVVPQGEGDGVEGELLAVGTDRLWVQDGDEIAEVPLPAVRTVRVRRHDFGRDKALKWALLGGLLTGGALTGACASVEGTDNCGVMGLVVAGAWLVVGALAGVSMESSSRIELWRPTAESLRPYARLPQGWPKSLGPPSLTLDPRDAEAPER